jgi:hypothetical protein
VDSKPDFNYAEQGIGIRNSYRNERLVFNILGNVINGEKNLCDWRNGDTHWWMRENVDANWEIGGDQNILYARLRTGDPNIYRTLRIGSYILMRNVDSWQTICTANISPLPFET